MKNNFKTIALLTIINTFAIGSDELSSGSPTTTSERADQVTKTPPRAIKSVLSAALGRSPGERSRANSSASTSSTTLPAPNQDLIEYEIQRICRMSTFGPHSFVHMVVSKENNCTINPGEEPIGRTIYGKPISEIIKFVLQKIGKTAAATKTPTEEEKEEKSRPMRLDEYMTKAAELGMQNIVYRQAENTEKPSNTNPSAENTEKPSNTNPSVAESCNMSKVMASEEGLRRLRDRFERQPPTKP